MGPTANLEPDDAKGSLVTKRMAPQWSRTPRTPRGHPSWPADPLAPADLLQPQHATAARAGSPAHGWRRPMKGQLGYGMAGRAMRPLNA